MGERKFVKKGLRYLTDKDYRFRFNSNLGLYASMPDDEYLKRKFKAFMGKELNLDNPQTFNEKLQWLKLYNRNPKYTMMVDKYKVRDYIAEKLGEEYLIPLLGVWDDPNDIDFDKLPNQFVLKCNHNSGLGMCICKDKSKLDIKKVKGELRKGLKQDYYLTGREWPYKDVKRKIIAEKFMTNGAAEPEDYKIHSFNGVPKIILVCKDRFMQSGLTEDFFSEKWEHLDIKRPGHPNAKVRQKIPAALKEMLGLSEKLSGGIPFVRTDFYLIGGKVYFGEMTFFPASGMEKFVPPSVDEKLGEWLKITGGGYLLKGKGFYLWIHEAGIEEPTDEPMIEAELTDYKFFCFDGYADCVMVCTERSSNEPKFYFFDRDWRLLRLNIRGKNAPKNFILPKPKCIDEMFSIAERLSVGCPFVRVDLYECFGRVLFGELTYFPDSGFDRNLLEETDWRFGRLINIRKEVM